MCGGCHRAGVSQLAARCPDSASALSGAAEYRSARHRCPNTGARAGLLVSSSFFSGPSRSSRATFSPTVPAPLFYCRPGSGLPFLLRCHFPCPLIFLPRISIPIHRLLPLFPALVAYPWLPTRGLPSASCATCPVPRVRMLWPAPARFSGTARWLFLCKLPP